MCLPLGIGVDNVKGHDILIFIGLGRELYFSILSCIQYFVVSGPYTFGFAA